MREAAPGIRVSISELAYRGERLYQDFTLFVPGGRWTCLLGPSGSGKSTLLRVVAGLEPSGRAEADDGGPITGRLAYMAQADLLLPWLSALDNAVLGWRLRRVPSAERREHRDRARELLRRLGLGERLAALPATLSGGERQRVALARTLLEGRPIVLMDEPFAALDAVTRHRLQALAAKLLSGRTVVLVTHDPREALRLGDTVRVMTGRPARLGEPILLAGAAPRDHGDPELSRLERDLMAELVASDDALARTR